MFDPDQPPDSTRNGLEPTTHLRTVRQRDPWGHYRDPFSYRTQQWWRNVVGDPEQGEWRDIDVVDL